jgi:uncharacterized protein (DUF1919 family)
MIFFKASIVRFTEKLLSIFFYSLSKKNLLSKKLSYLKSIKNKELTIFSCNCIAGTLYHDMGSIFKSPTINLMINFKDFYKFSKNVDYYLNVDLKELSNFNYNYPLGRLDDIVIHFVHYKSFSEALNKWNSRRKRISEDRFFIFTDRDNFDQDLLTELDKLQIKKVLFTSKELKYDWAVKIDRYDSFNRVGVLTNFVNFQGKRIYEVYFDFSKWFNGESVKNCSIKKANI